MPDTEPVFAREDPVLVLSRGSQVGLVVADAEMSAGEWWYKVRIGAGPVVAVPEDGLQVLADADEPLGSLAQRGQWGLASALRLALALERLRPDEGDANSLYSFNSHRLQFLPHQYKPLLKLIESDDWRLLIADEVGLGKTIEAGLILKELEARQDMDRVLVACPPRLRQKWEEEMSRRFDTQFDIFDGSKWREWMRRAATNERRGLPAPPLRCITSFDTLRRPVMLEGLEAAVGAGGIDLVIVDEAHHGRNPGTQTSKMLRTLGQVSDAVIFLTATPIHLRRDDLRVQLHALRPDDFSDAQAFDDEMVRNEMVLKALTVVRARDPETLEHAAGFLERAFGQGRRGGRSNPLASRVIAGLRSRVPITRRDWLDLMRDIERLHVLSDVMSRTRKREVIEHAPQRSAQWVPVNYTDRELALYESLVEDAHHRAVQKGQHPGFVTVQRQRMAASSLIAGRAYVLAKREDADASDVLEDWDLEGLQFFKDGEWGGANGGGPVEIPTRDLDHDTKLDQLITVLKGVDSHEPGAKVLVFTTFVPTSKYLQRELSKRGWNTARIAGDVVSNPLNPTKDDRGRVLEAFRTDPDLRVLISTEVGSEGLDFQYCHHLVNYDLPWNPMVVEQRIGRVDRWGQDAERVQIYSLVAENTIEDRILQRLFTRIGIFETSIGDIEDILGKKLEELAQACLDPRLTDEEKMRRTDAAADAIEQSRAEMAVLEERVHSLEGLGEMVKMQLERVEHLGRHPTARMMLEVLTKFLEVRHQDLHVLETEDEGIWRLRISDGLVEDVRRLGGAGGNGAAVLRRRERDGYLRFALEGEVAYHASSGVDLLNVSHPLVVTARTVVDESMQADLSRVGAAVVDLEAESDLEFEPGIYFLMLNALRVSGERRLRLLEVGGWCQDAGTVMDPDDAERLLHLTQRKGRDWLGMGNPPELPEEAWRQLTEDIRDRCLKEQARRREDAAALYDKRLTRLEGGRDRAINRAKKAMNTAEDRGNLDDRIRRMNQGRIEKAKARFDEKKGALDAGREVHVDLQDPLAMCVVEVRRR